MNERGKRFNEERGADNKEVMWMRRLEEGRRGEGR